MSDAVFLDGVTKSFDGHTAVEDLNLRVPEGSVYGFIGPNGSGKTTTLRIIMHILLADRGTVEVLGRPSVRAANDAVGYLPEERGLYRKMSVNRVLRYFAALKGMPPVHARTEIKRWLKRMDLAEWGGRSVESLSKGMSQKLQFIAAVISRPRLVLLDEPFSGLDPINLEVLREAVLELRAQGTTVILSTHDMTLAEEMCDFICMIFRGGKVLDGTLDAIKDRYGTDTVRLRLEGGGSHLKGFPGLESIRDLGRFQEVRLTTDPQELLTHLASRTKVRHFEVVRPSLKDIFIRIAGITDGEDGHA
ncbi:MAG: ATP-binding cassette domain-containing protein [Elusimicrobiota bacterium]